VERDNDFDDDRGL
jgi:hypothetical protein